MPVVAWVGLGYTEAQSLRILLSSPNIGFGDPAAPPGYSLAESWNQEAELKRRCCYIGLFRMSEPLGEIAAFLCVFLFVILEVLIYAKREG